MNWLTRCACIAVALLGGATPSVATFVNFETQHVHPIALAADQARLFVVNTPDNRLAVFDIGPDGTLSLAFEVPVGLDPVSVAVREAGQAWVANHISDTVSIVDLATQNVVATLHVGDEPTDVVFAGTVDERAFVCVSQEDVIKIYDADAPAAAPVPVPVFGSDPQALAVSADGSTVYAAVFESGNQTSIAATTDVTAHGGMPQPHPQGQPNTALILQYQNGVWRDPKGANYNNTHPYTLPDHDVVVLDADAPVPVPAYFDHVGTLNYNLGVHPVTGKLYVSNTNALNAVRHEPNLRGKFLRTRVSIVDPGNPTQPVHADVNAHINYGVTPGPQSEIDQSLSQPGGFAFAADGSTIYMTSLGSQKVAVLDAAGNVVDRIDTAGEGPSGVVLDETHARLYVVNRFTNSVDAIDTATRQVVQSVQLFDPSPVVIKTGRKFLYDGRISSGHGDLACASCHAGSNMDGIAWDLGDPNGAFQDPPDGQLDPFLTGFDAMKGPMATQTLRGLAGTEPFHWRGDRAGFGDFNPAFVSLMGREDPLSNADMQAFEDFIMTVAFPPNPHQNLDRTFPDPAGQPSAEQGRIDFLTINLDGVRCVDCHALPAGTNQQIFNGPILQSSQDIKVPQLRNMYEKTDFAMTPGEKKRGFGYIHDASTPTLFQFLQFPGFSFTSDAQRRDMEQFLLAFDTGIAPSVGAQLTVDAANKALPATTTWIDVLVAQDLAGNCDLVVKGRHQDIPRGWVHQGDDMFLSDRGNTFTRGQLIGLAGSGAELTFMGVPEGSGSRIGIDRDDDTFPDRMEIEGHSDPTDPGSTPDPTGVGPLAGRTTYELATFPNPAPAASGTTISFQLAERHDVRLRIFDVHGRHVATLVEGPQGPGTVQRVWTGVDHTGRSVASGKYFYRLTVGGHTIARSLLVIR